MNKVIHTAHEFFKDAGFDYAICGGFALDMFVGQELRTHGDFDIMVFKEDKHLAVDFFMNKSWPVYGRFMEEGKIVTNFLFHKINNIKDEFWDECRNMWTIKPGSLPEMYKHSRLQGEVYSYKPLTEWKVENLEFVELEFDAKDGGDYVAKENPKITRPLDKAILHREGIPYLAPEIVLFYKSDKFSSEHPNVKPKTESDFKTIMPLLPAESKKWLLEAIDTAYPDGYEWLDGLL